MKILRFIISLILCIFHPEIQEEVTIQLKDFISGDICQYSFCIPRGYKRLIVITPDMYWGDTYCYQYRYYNGIVFYFGNNRDGVDHKAIEQSLGHDRFSYLVGNYFLQEQDLVDIMDIPPFWDLSGYDKKNRYWRDVETFSWVIGFKGVPKRFVNVFNAIIDSYVQKYNNDHYLEGGDDG